MPVILSSSELSQLGMSLPAWSLDHARKALYRRLVFTGFGEALAAMVRIGIEAEKADHHPEWSNVYDTIEIWLTTHDVGGILDADVCMAHVIDRMFPLKPSDAPHLDEGRAG